MYHYQKNIIEPIYTSTSQFGCEFENQFALLDDAKYVIGVDGSQANNLILENIQTGKAEKFRWRRSYMNINTTLIYDEETGFLYIGDRDEHLRKYRIDKTSKTFIKVKDFGKLGIYWIKSSHRFLHFVFFGGDDHKIRVLDLSTDEFLTGNLETSIEYTFSLQVCVKSPNKIYLVVSGLNKDFSKDKIDLLDVTGLLSIDPVILQDFAPEYASNHGHTILTQKPKQDTQEDKHVSIRHQKINDILHSSTPAEDQPHNLKKTLDAPHRHKGSKSKKSSLKSNTLELIVT